MDQQADTETTERKCTGMSTEYHKISTPFKRHFDGPNKGKLIMGDWAVPELEYLADNEWEFTEKVDGTNIRIELIRPNNEFLHVEYRGRTDNANIPTHLLEYLEETFPTNGNWRRDLSRPAYYERHREVEQWMIDNGLNKVVLYGEGYGPKIQKGGGNYRKDASFVLFDVKIGDFWLDRENVNDVAEKLGIDAVPVIGRGTLWDAIDIVSGVDDHGVYQTNVGGLTSQWGDFEAEGIVARPIVPLFNRQGNRIITKIKGVDFK
jgi:hypothetical protein